MKLLLDTHILIWWVQEPEKLSQQVLALCRDPNNTLILSVVSIWEIQVKHQLGKAEYIVRMPLAKLVKSQRAQNNVVVLPVKLAHVLALGNLPFYPDHKDPFDRLLIAQANAEDITLLSVDDKIHRYSYPVVLLR